MKRLLYMSPNVCKQNASLRAHLETWPSVTGVTGSLCSGGFRHRRGGYCEMGLVLGAVLKVGACVFLIPLSPPLVTELLTISKMFAEARILNSAEKNAV